MTCPWPADGAAGPGAALGPGLGLGEGEAPGGAGALVGLGWAQGLIHTHPGDLGLVHTRPGDRGLVHARPDHPKETFWVVPWLDSSITSLVEVLE